MFLAYDPEILKQILLNRTKTRTLKFLNKSLCQTAAIVFFDFACKEKSVGGIMQ